MPETKLTKLKPNPANPRLIKDERFEKLCKSLQDFPRMMELRPIVVDDGMMILGGNMRYKALMHLGYKAVPPEWIKQAADLTEAQKQEFIIKDNVGFGENDWDILANEWDTEKLVEWGMELPLGFATTEVEEDAFDAVPPLNPITVLGDVYELNQHRFSCGSSTEADVVNKTLDGARPILMVTDPPYGVNYDPTWRHAAGIINSRRQGKVENDDRAGWADAYSLFSGNVVYVWHGGRHAKTVAEDLETSGFDIVCQIIWNKQQLVMSRGDYHWKHEPCWYAVRKGVKHNWQGSRKESTVWDITSILQSAKKEKEDAALVHGTQKPIECMARPIRNNTYERESVYDPFLGSGTTLIAADQLNRACYGQEIDPAYCDIIVARWIKYRQSKTPSSATAVKDSIKRNGKELSAKEIKALLNQIEKPDEN